MSDEIKVEEASAQKQEPELTEDQKAARTFIHDRYNKLSPEVRKLVHREILRQTNTSALVSNLGPRFAVCAFVGTLQCGDEDDEKITPPFLLCKGHPLAVAGLMGSVTKEIVERAVAHPGQEHEPVVDDKAKLKIVTPND